MGASRGGQLLPLGTVGDFFDDVPAAMSAARTRLQDGAAWRNGDVVEIGDVQLAAPVPDDAKILCAGLNYGKHVAEAHETADAGPSTPDLFARWRSTLCGSGQTVPIPPSESGLDWEGELAAILGIGLHGCDSAAEAGDAILGYTCFNDLSARTFQFNGRQAGLGKNADRSGPIGPCIVTTDEIGVAPARRLRTIVDGEVMQDASTAEMIFDAAQIAAYASGCLTLSPGDVICTGTPEGVGYFRTPRRLLTSGSEVVVEIDGIGRLRSGLR
jgi:2-keto-4-pentenoate hydratase/2-oxohepta-3-ene-1,7-dioic acid hydratase in catechol pathway